MSGHVSVRMVSTGAGAADRVERVGEGGERRASADATESMDGRGDSSAPLGATATLRSNSPSTSPPSRPRSTLSHVPSIATQEIYRVINIRNAKLLALALVLLIVAYHAVLRYKGLFSLFYCLERFIFKLLSFD